MRKWLPALLILGLVFCNTSTSSAFVLAGGYTGPLKFKFSDFSNGEVTPFSTPGYGHADGVEDSFGIFKVTTINADDAFNTLLWFDGKDGEELTGMYYNLDDDLRNASGGGVDIESINGKLDIYLDSTPDFSAAGGPGARSGTSSYPTATDGSPFLKLAMAPGVKYGDGDPSNDYISYHNHLNALTNPITGNGVFYADVIGGTYASMFDTNGICITDDSGVVHCRDFFNEFDTKPGKFGWLVTSEDPVTGNVVPEPLTMILLGSGFMGMVGTRLRKKTV